MNNFDLKNFLVENKLTSNSKKGIHEMDTPMMRAAEKGQGKKNNIAKIDYNLGIDSVRVYLSDSEYIDISPVDLLVDTLYHFGENEAGDAVKDVINNMHSTENTNEIDSNDSIDRAYDEVAKDVDKAKKLANLIAPGDDMLQKAATYGASEVIQVGADVAGNGSDDVYAYDGVLTQNDFMQMFRKAGYSSEAIDVLMDINYVRKVERG